MFTLWVVLFLGGWSWIAYSVYLSISWVSKQHPPSIFCPSLAVKSVLFSELIMCGIASRLAFKFLHWVPALTSLNNGLCRRILSWEETFLPLTVFGQSICPNNRDQPRTVEFRGYMSSSSFCTQFIYLWEEACITHTCGVQLAGDGS